MWCVCEREVEGVGWRDGKGEGVQTRIQGKMGMLMYKCIKSKSTNLD